MFGSFHRPVRSPGKLRDVKHLSHWSEAKGSYSVSAPSSVACPSGPATHNRRPGQRVWALPSGSTCCGLLHRNIENARSLCTKDKQKTRTAVSNKSQPQRHSSLTNSTENDQHINDCCIPVAIFKLSNCQVDHLFLNIGGNLFPAVWQSSLVLSVTCEHKSATLFVRCCDFWS